MVRIKYSKELLEDAVKDSFSIADVCRKIGLKPLGGNYKTVKNKLDLFNVDYSHFTGQTWNKGLKHCEKSSRFYLEEILQENVDYSSDLLKKRLINEGLKENKCECCGICEENLVLELHHINGNHYDNRLENLQILCPNCHSKTNNFRGRNVSKDSGIKLSEGKNHWCICQNCGKKFYSDRTDKTRKFCSRKCYNEYINDKGSINLSKGVNISKEIILENLDSFKDISNFAKFLNVSKTTLRNYLIKYGLYEQFKTKYDFKAKAIIQYDIDGNFIKEWPSIVDAEETLQIKGICKVTNLQRRSCGGFIWRYKE